MYNNIMNVYNVLLFIFRIWCVTLYLDFDDLCLTVFLFYMIISIIIDVVSHIVLFIFYTYVIE